jgi:Tol biopolymer transport system component
MSTAPQSRGSPPSEAAVRAQLERVLSSTTFARAERLGRFLAFVVGETLAGRGETLKESVIASALYRGDTGGSDSVVRVDARRLRDKLREFYSDRRAEPLLISLPKGSYVPRFETGGVESTEESSLPAPKRARSLPVAAGVLTVVVLTGGILFRSGRDPVEFTPVPLTSYPGFADSPSLSPVGNFVAFAWSQDNLPLRIFVKSVRGDEVRQLTQGPSENNPVWSPDGRLIAYTRAVHGVFVISPLGGQPRRISETGSYAAWSADSASLFVRELGANGSNGIVRISLETLEPRQVTQAPVGDGDWRFQVSPDGKTLAFIRYERSGISDLYVQSLTGGVAKRLTNWNAVLTGVAWTPNGRELVYSVQEGAGIRLWRIPSNNRSPGRGHRLLGVDANSSQPSISRPPAGVPVRLAYVSGVLDIGLRLVNLGEAKNGVFSEVRPVADSSRAEQPRRFSPDGARVAFSSDRDGEPGIWAADRDGSNLQKILAGDGTMSWSPDGRSIVFDLPVEGNTDLYVKSLDGGQPRRLTSEPSIDGTPEWSRDGKWVYFTSTRAGNRAQIWRMPPDGGAAMPVTQNGGARPRETPDGRFLYYLDRLPSGMNGRGRLMRVQSGGGEETEVLADIGAWTWDVSDNGIVFLATDGNDSFVDLIRFENHQRVRLGQLPFRPARIAAVGWTVSRDGRWLLTNQVDRLANDLMLIDNFR